MCNMIEISERVKEIQEQLNQDIADLEVFAKEKNLTLNYDRRDVHLKQRLNDEWLTYPRIHTGGFGKLAEVVYSACVNSLSSLERDIYYHFKFKPSTDKLFQVKVTYFRQIGDIRLYLERKHKINFPYISEYQTESKDIIVKKFQNGNAIVQLTEEAFNILKSYVKED